MNVNKRVLQGKRRGADGFLLFSLFKICLAYSKCRNKPARDENLAFKQFDSDCLMQLSLDICFHDLCMKRT